MEVNTKEDISINDINPNVQEKLIFGGTQTQFNQFYSALTERQIKAAKELHLVIKPKDQEQGQHQEPDFQDTMKTCLCCACLHQTCPGFMCFLDCLFIILFFWILCPIFCCWAYCKAKSLQDELLQIFSLKEETYEKMQKIGQKANLMKVRVQVSDVTLNKDKIDHLKYLIDKSGVMQFELRNDGIAGNDPSSDYSNFRGNIREIISIPNLKYEIKWSNIELYS